MKLTNTISASLLTISLFTVVSVFAPITLAEGNIPAVLTPTLPNGYVGKNYIATVRTRDADVGDQLTIMSAGLPEGLSLTNCQQFVLSNSQRLYCDLTGVVTAPAGDYTFKIGVRDQDGNIGTQHYTINLSQAP